MAAAQGASKDESDTDDDSKVKFEDLEVSRSFAELSTIGFD